MHFRKILTLCASLALSFCISATALASFRNGDEGQEVLDLQKRLVELNYPISSLTGFYGDETEGAVKAFQQNAGLEADGVVGPATFRAIMNKEMPVNRAEAPVVKRVLNTAMRLLGTPYVFGGTTPYGFDCSGFVQYCFRAAGIELPRTCDAQIYVGRPIQPSQLRRGDLVFFTTYEPGASHVGIYLGDGNFIHAGGRAVKISPVFTDYYGCRWYGACRIR
ncbi:MAG: NlpC/P60 family protein [Phascolarctobacterium sp.]|nr:NlpC/P60 family protein [Phascolarctobacterium sp.]